MADNALSDHYAIYDEGRAFIEGYLSPGVKPRPHGHASFIEGCLGRRDTTSGRLFEHLIE